MAKSRDNVALHREADSDALHAVKITHLRATSLRATSDNAVILQTSTPLLAVLLSSAAVLMPDDIPLMKDWVILLPAGSTFKIAPGPDGLLPELASVDFSFELHGLDATFVLPELPVAYSSVDRGAEEFKDAICTICRTPETGLGMTEAAERLSAGYRIAAILTRMQHLDTEQVRAHQNDPDLKTLLLFLRENYREPLVVEDIARSCQFSRRKLFKVAARLNNLTPMRLLKRLRLQQSLILLRKPDLNVSTVAAMTGFQDAKNFSREFKKQFGVTAQQYRQQSISTMHAATLLEKAEINMQGNHPRRASVLYNQAIEAAPNWSRVDELHYKTGVALRRTGNFDGADQAWAKITSLYYRQVVQLDECDRRNKGLEYQEIVEVFRGVYEHAGEELKDRIAASTADWAELCATTDKYVAARHYCEYGKELAKRHGKIIPPLARSLYLNGDYEGVLRVCPDQEFHVAGSLRIMARYREHLDRFPHLRMQCALIHLRMGNPEIVLSDYQAQPKQCVKALCGLGRYEDAIEQFPEHSAPAMLALGRFQQVLDEHPSDDEACMWALALMDKQQEAIDRARSYQELLTAMLLYYNKPNEIVLSADFGRSARKAAILQQAIHLLHEQNYADALELCGSVLPMTHRDAIPTHAFYHTDLLMPLIYHALPNDIPIPADSPWPNWNDHFAEIVENHQFCFAQQHWYDMRLIMGEIDDADYLAQPNCYMAANEIVFKKGLKADFQGESDHAREFYQAYLDILHDTKNLYFLRQWDHPVKREFIHWRLKELGARS